MKLFGVTIQTTPERPKGLHPEHGAPYTANGPSTAQLVEGGYLSRMVVVKLLPQPESVPLTCWACDTALTLEDLPLNDGFCIHCDNEIEL